MALLELLFPWEDRDIGRPSLFGRLAEAKVGLGKEEDRERHVNQLVQPQSVGLALGSAAPRRTARKREVNRMVDLSLSPSNIGTSNRPPLVV